MASGKVATLVLSWEHFVPSRVPETIRSILSLVNNGLADPGFAADIIRLQDTLPERSEMTMRYYQSAGEFVRCLSRLLHSSMKNSVEHALRVILKAHAKTMATQTAAPKTLKPKTTTTTTTTSELSQEEQEILAAANAYLPATAEDPFNAAAELGAAALVVKAAKAASQRHYTAHPWTWWSVGRRIATSPQGKQESNEAYVTRCATWRRDAIDQHPGCWSDENVRHVIDSVVAHAVVSQLDTTRSYNQSLIQQISKENSYDLGQYADFNFLCESIRRCEPATAPQRANAKAFRTEAEDEVEEEDAFAAKHAAKNKGKRIGDTRGYKKNAKRKKRASAKADEGETDEVDEAEHCTTCKELGLLTRWKHETKDCPVRLWVKSANAMTKNQFIKTFKPQDDAKKDKKNEKKSATQSEPEEKATANLMRLQETPSDTEEEASSLFL
jgi:hypothetical protein